MEDVQDTIDIQDETQLHVWARRFGIPPDHLAQLIAQLGPSLQRIRDTLKREELSRSGGRRINGR